MSWLLLVSLAAAGCSGATPGPGEASAPATRAPAGTDSVETESPEPGLESEEPTESSEATTDPVSSEEPEPGSDDPFVGRVVASTVDRLRLRAAAGTDADNLRSLRRGTTLFVLGGPTEASDYTWYQVVPLAGADTTVGWVAAASLSGVAWIETAEAECPATPETFGELLALTPGERVACFGRTPISVTARLAPCDCDVDPAAFDPEWFGVTADDDGAPVLLADPATEGPVEREQGLPLLVDPAGDAEDPLPIGEVVEVTGVFDHRAAASCTRSDDGGPAEPDVSCRFEFAVTSMKVAAA